MKSNALRKPAKAPIDPGVTPEALGEQVLQLIMTDDYRGLSHLSLPSVMADKLKVFHPLSKLKKWAGIYPIWTDVFDLIAARYKHWVEDKLRFAIENYNVRHTNPTLLALVAQKVLFADSDNNNQPAPLGEIKIQVIADDTTDYIGAEVISEVVDDL